MTGAELAQARETLGWSCARLAQHRGVAETTIRRMEAGERPIEPDLGAWLRRAVGWLQRNPVPRQNGSRYATQTVDKNCAP